MTKIILVEIKVHYDEGQLGFCSSGDVEGAIDFLNKVTQKVDYDKHNKN